MAILLQTERLILRDFIPDDTDNLVRLDSDPEVMRFLTGGKPTVATVLSSFLSPRGRLARWVWVAVDRRSGGFAGWFSLRPVEETAALEAELGFRLRRQFWNRGYATEGARALISKGFTDLGLTRIHAETMFVNRPSRRVMEKAGLRYVRTFHPGWDDPIAGSEHGEVEYALTREQWQR